MDVRRVRRVIKRKYRGSLPWGERAAYSAPVGRGAAAASLHARMPGGRGVGVLPSPVPPASPLH